MRGSGPALALISTLATVAALEGLGRLLDVDFELRAHAYNSIPIFFRAPSVPVGPAFFRRPGPDRWDGKPLRQMYRMAGGTGDRFADEAEVSIRYDALGFRNPETLHDWEIVVVGDSFTELGHLPWEDLFTTRLGELLGVRVKNLGVSLTGTFAHVFYLAEYGKASSTRDAVVVFFEGNDFSDMEGEHEGIVTAAAPGGRHPARVPMPTGSITLAPQHSFLRAVYRLATGMRDDEPVGRLPAGRNPDPDRFDAWYVWKDTRTPVGFEFVMPANLDPFTPERRALLNEAIHDWATTAARLGLRPWLVYLPSKRHLLDGYLVWKPGTRATPLPSGVGALIRSTTEANGVRFIDAAAALRRETEAGRLTYNALGDGHLNRLGSLTVARAIADAMAPVWANGRAVQ